MKTDIIFATHNQNKVKEIQSLMPDAFRVLSLSDIGFHNDIPETAPTLEGNAELKSDAIYSVLGKSVFSDDTGLEVEALDSAPGVYSARYAGLQKNDEDNMNLLLEKLMNAENRRARFRTSICLILHGEKHFFEGIVNGEIATEKSGNRGFGYDPIFIPEGYSSTFADMSANEKNEISHRGRAFKKMLDFLQA